MRFNFKLKEVITIEKVIQVSGADIVLAIFGFQDENLKRLEKEFKVVLVCRGIDIKITGEEKAVESVAQIISALSRIYKSGLPLDEQAVSYCISLANDGETEKLGSLTGEVLLISDKGRPVRPKTLGQKTYIQAIAKNPITFAVGPAGTGKTYLAVAMAVKAYKAQEVTRIILTRPAVEAGEKLGFLPGDMQDKVDPYLRPLYDALYDMLGAETCQRLMEKQIIEVAPLAYMRGRTLDDAFIILDEAQNTSKEQMKMFLTRMGIGSRMVVTGDITQIDIPDKSQSGLVDAVSVLKNIEGVAHTTFTEKDVVRHRLVQEIIKAYDKAAAEIN